MTERPPLRLMHVVTDAVSLGFLRGQLRHFRDQGHEVSAVSAPGPEQQTFQHEEHVAVHAIPFCRRVSPLRDLRALVSLCRLFRRVRPSITHCGTPKAGLLGMLAATACGVPHRIYHVRGLRYMGARGLARWILQRLERVACALAHRVLCDSPSIRSVLVGDGLCPVEKTWVVGHGSCNGVNAQTRFNPRSPHARSSEAVRAAYGIPSSAPVVGFVGRLTRDKGIRELSEAWPHVRRTVADARLLLVGPAEVGDAETRTALERLEADTSVRLTGSLTDPAPAYLAMDVLCLPTYREGLPISPLEAAAMETPVVATRVPGCIEAVEDGVTGTLVPDHDSRSLATALVRYLESPDLASRHGTAGRARVLRLFEPERIWRDLLKGYESLSRTNGEHRASPTPPAASSPAFSNESSR